MRAFAFSEYNDRPPQRVWDVLCDLELVADTYSREHRRVSEIIAFEPPRRQVYRSAEQPKIGGQFEFLLNAEGSGTRISFTLDLWAVRPLQWMFVPIVANGERRLRREMLGAFKRLVESLPA